MPTTSHLPDQPIMKYVHPADRFNTIATRCRSRSDTFYRAQGEVSQVSREATPAQTI